MKKYVLVIMTLLGFVIFASGCISEEKQEITKQYKLLDSQMAGINYVNFNFTSNAGGFGVSFQNKSDLIYDITFERDKNSKEPSITYNKKGDVLNVNIVLDSGSANVILGNRCTYNGTFDTKAGGFSLMLANDSKVDVFNTTIKYAGGGMVNIADTSFNHLDMNVNTGGFMIQSDKLGIKKDGSISTGVEIGGVTVQLKPVDKIGIKIKGTVDLGGIAIEPTGFEVIKNNTTFLDAQTKNYNKKAVKLQIESTVGLGGINMNMMPIFS